MTDESVKRILTAPVVLRRPSNEEECARFRNKKGWFYTFGLESGPRFVARIDKKEDIFTFRALDDSVAPLVQFRWESTHTSIPGLFPMWDVECETAPGTTDEEKDRLEEILGPKGTEYVAKGCFGLLRVKLVHYTYPDIFIKAYKLKKRLLAQEAKRQELLEVRKEFRSEQRKVQGCVILPQGNNDNSINQMVQHKLNERRQNG